MAPVTMPAVLPTFVADPFPKPAGALASNLPPKNVPACPGAQSLEKPIVFSWEERSAYDWQRATTLMPDQNWTYYRCDQPVATAVAFYQRAMAPAEGNGIDNDVQEYPDGTLLIYTQKVEGTKRGKRWAYVWLFPVTSDSQVSDLVSVWYDDVGC